MYLGLHVPHRESIAIKSIAGLLAAMNHETSQIIYNHIFHRYQILVIGQLFNTCELFNNFLLMLPLFLNLTKTQDIDIPSTFDTESVSNVSVSVLLKANFSLSCFLKTTSVHYLVLLIIICNIFFTALIVSDTVHQVDRWPLSVLHLCLYLETGGRSVQHCEPAVHCQTWMYHRVGRHYKPG